MYRMKASASSLILLVVFLSACHSFVFAESVQNENSVVNSKRQIEIEPLNSSRVEEITGRNGNMNNEMMSGKKKDKNNGLQKMYMIFMMCKTLISTLLMFVSPILGIKSFGLSLIGTIINIARFVMELKNGKSGGNNGSSNLMSGLNLYGGGGAWNDHERVGFAYSPALRPAYFSHYPNYIHKYHNKS